MKEFDKKMTPKKSRLVRGRKRKRWTVALLMCIVSASVVMAVVMLSRDTDRNSSSDNAPPAKTKPKTRVSIPSSPQMRIERYTQDEYVLKRAEDTVAELQATKFHNGDSEKIFASIASLAACCVQSTEVQDYLVKAGLGSQERKMKEVALIALGATMQDGVVQKIAEVMKNDPDTEIRQLAAAALCQQKEERVTGKFTVADLGSSIGVGAPFSAAAWEALADAIVREENGEVRNSIVQLLSIGVPQGIKGDRYIAIAFDKRYPSSLRRNIIYELTGKAEGETVRQLLEMAANKEEDLAMRIAALQVLGKADISGDSLKPMAQVLSDGTEAAMLRFMAGRILVRRSPQEILATYQAGAEGGSPFTAQTKALDALLWLVSNDPDEREAINALKVVGQIGDVGTVPMIQQAITVRGNSPRIQEAASEIIRQLSGGLEGVDN